jgi:hypothetical protein
MFENATGETTDTRTASVAAKRIAHDKAVRIDERRLGIMRE